MENQLIKAVISDNVVAVTKLLEAGTDPNVCEDKDKVTPLHFVAQKDSPEALAIASLLLRAGANPLAQTEPDGETPLDVARIMSNERMATLLASVGGNQVWH